MEPRDRTVAKFRDSAKSSRRGVPGYLFKRSDLIKAVTGGVGGAK